MPMDRQAKLRSWGYYVALLGLAVALVSIVPGLFGKSDFPWTLFIGSFIYLHGAFMVMFGSRGADPKKTMSSLRLVRLGFVGIVAVLIWQTLAQ
jgi:hypothetical protein